jgi:cyclomaltodextrinase / maltogenic alpha-amylase / neopullulanase
VAETIIQQNDSLMKLIPLIRSTLKHALVIAGSVVFLMTASTAQSATARKSPEFLEKAVVYQISLRAFTPEGTLNAAAAHLPRLAQLGIDVVYLCPIALQDDDLRPEFWSPRQKASKLGNPQNPYRIKDYFKIDPEYGTEADLKAFVAQAHALKIKVLLDLVYLHCGPAAPIIETHPDFVIRDASGEVAVGEWAFPLLNFKSQGLRQYLWENMEYFIREFDVDGYRCDVGYKVPLDFWEEGRRRIEALKPDAIMIDEGDREADQNAAFDLCYGSYWKRGVINLLSGKKTAVDLRNEWQKKHDTFPTGARFLRMLDNHDNAMDSGNSRYEKRWGNQAIESILLINFAMDGVPYLYNGMEIADARPHSIFANRFYGKEMRIDWAEAEAPKGKARQDYVRNLIALRRANPALTEGVVKWLDNDQPEQVVSFVRQSDGQKILLVVNVSKEARTVTVRLDDDFRPGDTMMNQGVKYKAEGGALHAEMAPYGYLLMSY